jgi:hypothetical protein
MNNNSLTGLFGVWLLLQLVVLLVLLLGGLYALFCLNRAALGLDRLAAAVENWVAHDAARNAPILPGQNNTPDWIRPIELPTASPTAPDETEAPRG